MIITDKIIDEAIKKAGKDQYGQTKIINLQIECLFPNNIVEVREYLKVSKKYMLSTYGWKYGTYKAICLR